MFGKLLIHVIITPGKSMVWWAAIWNTGSLGSEKEKPLFRCQIQQPCKYLDSGTRNQNFFLQVEYLGSADIQRLATEATIE